MNSLDRFCYKIMAIRPQSYWIPVGVGAIGSVIFIVFLDRMPNSMMVALPVICGFIGGLWVRYLEGTRLKEKTFESSAESSPDMEQSLRDIWNLAFFDELTGLSNRVRFNIKMLETIKSAIQYDKKIALLLVDIEGLKLLNDSLGCDASDQLIREISTRLVDTVRQVDYVARLGSNEFCVVVTHISDDKYPAHVAVRCLKSLQKPVSICTREIFPRANIGIALFPQHGKTVEKLVQCATSAMHVAEKDGQKHYSYYDMNLAVLAKRQLNLENDLRHALAAGEFELYYQPQISLESGRIVAVEALIRWHHPEHGLIPPDMFIPIIEKMGLISALGEWVINTACHQLAKWKNSPDQLVDRVAVNISAAHFNNMTLVGTVVDALKDTGIDANDLVIEITESMLQTTKDSLENIEAVKQLGVTVAIDDFGTGYSCLASLAQLPIDSIKIDKVFVQDVLNNVNNSAIVATIISMSKTIGFSVVAEGIETLEQLEYIRHMGCPIGQGNFISRPVCADQIEELVGFDCFNKIRHQNCT